MRLQATNIPVVDRGAAALVAQIKADKSNWRATVLQRYTAHLEARAAELEGQAQRAEASPASNDAEVAARAQAVATLERAAKENRSVAQSIRAGIVMFDPERAEFLLRAHEFAQAAERRAIKRGRT